MKSSSWVLLGILIICCQLITSCQLTSKKAGTDEHSAEFVLDYQGVYKGTLPCADCPGIETTLTLNTDQTFVYETCYLEKEDARFSNTGRYTVKEDILTIHADGRPIHFLMGEGELTMLNEDLKAPTGVLAPLYILKKQR